VLKKRQKGGRIVKNTVVAACVAALFCPVIISAADNAAGTDEFEIKPAYIFQNKAGRDPFEPRYKREAVPAMAEIDITAFSLQGITIDAGGGKAALFRSKSGNPFGYIFMDGKLYGENDQVIPDVAGEIRPTNEVLLIQGDKEVLFKLEEDTGPGSRNISPGK
jgi:hypothetical protein